LGFEELGPGKINLRPGTVLEIFGMKSTNPEKFYLSI